MTLLELEPRWSKLPGRRGMGVTFRCPHCETRLAVWFRNPLDGGAPYEGSNADNTPGLWQRTGETFETLTLTPSIDASARGHWHGFITAGQVIP